MSTETLDDEYSFYVVEQHLIRMAKQESTIEVAGRQIKLSNLDKVLYPKVGFTKGQVVDYMVLETQAGLFDSNNASVRIAG